MEQTRSVLKLGGLKVIMLPNSNTTACIQKV